MNLLDQPEISQALFYPRKERPHAPLPPGARRVSLEVEPGIIVGGRLYPAGQRDPAILFFHGNGEIAADYDGVAPLYTGMGISLLVMDYRGYGQSGGNPSARSLLADAVMAFEGADELLAVNGLNPDRLYVMGRSLGSAAAIEVAARSKGGLAGLIVESGFSDTFALLSLLGVRVSDRDELSGGFGNLPKIERVTLPTLVIHGQNDRLIPASDGRALYNHCAASEKRLVLIPGAGHNDLLWVGRALYFGTIGRFIGFRRKQSAINSG